LHGEERNVFVLTIVEPDGSSIPVLAGGENFMRTPIVGPEEQQTVPTRFHICLDLQILVTLVEEPQFASISCDPTIVKVQNRRDQSTIARRVVRVPKVACPLRRRVAR